MGYVVDATVAAKWLLLEPDSETAARVAAARPLLAPELVVAEVANVLWKAARAGRLPHDRVVPGAWRLLQAFDELIPLAELVGRALAFARQLDHPVYDCFYLALAEARGLPLVTADGRLSGRLAGGPWAGLVQPLGGLAAG